MTCCGSLLFNSLSIHYERYVKPLVLPLCRGLFYSKKNKIMSFKKDEDFERRMIDQYGIRGFAILDMEECPIRLPHAKSLYQATMDYYRLLPAIYQWYDDYCSKHKKSYYRRKKTFDVNFIFAWYDFWVGFFWDSKKRKLYFLPLPCMGLVFTFEK